MRKVLIKGEVVFGIFESCLSLLKSPEFMTLRFSKHMYRAPALPTLPLSVEN